jgi:hypothetical protein
MLQIGGVLTVKDRVSRDMIRVGTKENSKAIQDFRLGAEGYRSK